MGGSSFDSDARSDQTQAFPPKSCRSFLDGAAVTMAAHAAANRAGCSNLDSETTPLSAPGASFPILLFPDRKICVSLSCAHQPHSHTKLHPQDNTGTHHRMRSAEQNAPRIGRNQGGKLAPSDQTRTLRPSQHIWSRVDTFISPLLTSRDGPGRIFRRCRRRRCRHYLRPPVLPGRPWVAVAIVRAGTGRIGGACDSVYHAPQVSHGLGGGNLELHLVRWVGNRRGACT